MASSIKQRITKAKEELQDHISSEGIDVTPHKDDIEQMKDILEKDSFDRQRPNMKALMDYLKNLKII